MALNKRLLPFHIRWWLFNICIQNQYLRSQFFAMFQFLLITLLNVAPADSLRMETINGKQYVVYQVGEKETLYSIARKYGATTQQVLEVNPSADAGLEVGQILKIPYTPRVRTQQVQTAEGVIHKVVPKETLFSIARQYGVTVDEIRTWNNLKEGAGLVVGQEIVIKNKKVTPTETKQVTETKPAQLSAASTHTVLPKETLYSISKQYGMTVDQLKEWNNIKGNELKVGQVLTVAAPAAAVSVAKDPIKISETVTGTDEIHEKGMAALIEGSESNRKYLAQHRSIAPGTILKVRNLDNNQEVFVRITGPSTITDDPVMIRLSKSAYDRLAATEAPFRVELIYYK